MFCDFRNRGELARDHLPQDLLYVLTLYVEALNNAIRAARGTISYVELDSICALFGLDRGTGQAAQNALQAVAAIEGVIADINNRLGRQWDCKMNVAVTVHVGRAAVGEIGASDPPTVIAIGEAVDVANALRKAAAAQGKQFAISEAGLCRGRPRPAAAGPHHAACAWPRPGCPGIGVGDGPVVASVVETDRGAQPPRGVAAAVVRLIRQA